MIYSMKNSWLYLCCSLMLFACKSEDKLNVSNTSFSKTEVITSVTNKTIVPSVLDFKNEVQRFKTSVESFYAETTEQKLTVVQENWKAMMYAFAQIKPFNIGRVQYEYFYIHLGTKPALVKIIEKELQSSVDINEQFFETTAVSTKGISALEYLIFNAKKSNANLINWFSEPSIGKRRKNYLYYASKNLLSKSKVLIDFWDGTNQYAFELIENKGSGVDESLNRIMNGVITQVEAVTIKEIGIPLAKSGGGVNPEKFPYYRSNQSLSYMEGILEVIKKVLEGNGDQLGINKLLDEKGAKYNGKKLSEAISEQIIDIENNMTNIRSTFSSVENALDQNRTKVELLYEDWKGLLALLKIDVTNSLSITLTASENDGD